MREGWRKTIDAIVSAFAEGDFELARGLADVEPSSTRLAQQRRFFVSSQGVTLSSSWEAASANPTGSGWDVVVKLAINESARSHLRLDVRVTEHEGRYRFTAGLIYAE